MRRDDIYKASGSHVLCKSGVRVAAEGRQGEKAAEENGDRVYQKL